MATDRPDAPAAKVRRETYEVWFEHPRWRCYSADHRTFDAALGSADVVQRMFPDDAWEIRHVVTTEETIQRG